VISEPPDRRLTALEVRLLQALADGAPLDDAARSPSASAVTAHDSLRSIMGKLEVGSRVEAVAAGLQRGLIRGRSS